MNKVKWQLSNSRWVIPGLLSFVILLSCDVAGQSEQSSSTKPFAQLSYRTIGPLGNRTSSMVGVPGDPLVAYIGAAAGGVWKTEDGGTHWEPIFDGEDVQAIGAITLDPSNPNTVWVGTGEGDQIRPWAAMGDGVYKSTDAGHTWVHVGLDKTGHIGHITVDPKDSNVVYVCSIGELYKPSHEQGIFKSIDGGKTWKKSLFVNDNTGCSSITMDPQDPNTLFAGMWQMQIRPWNLGHGGLGSGVYVSHDAGATWKKLTGHGLPAASTVVGKTAVQVAPSDPKRVYALIEESVTPRFYRSDDGGQNWTLAHQGHIISMRAPYFNHFGVDPKNADKIMFVSVNYNLSMDGGRTLEVLPPESLAAGGDNHAVWFDPKDPNRVMIANDGGGSISRNGGKTWHRVVLPIAGMYDVRVDNDVPYHVMGNRQDGPSYWGPSNNLARPGFFSRGITAGDWKNIGGCESGISTPEPDDSSIIWSGCFDGQVSRADLKTGESRMVSPWPEATYGWAPKDTKYRWEWFPPFAISPFKPHAKYVGANVVFKSTNEGQSWSVISPDLTTNDKSHQQDSGLPGAHDNPPGTYDGSVLYAIDVSPVKPGIIWTGSSDGQINITEDDGAHWTNVTKNIPDLPPWGIVTGVHPSPFLAGGACLTVSFQQTGNYNPHVYRTSDFGATWTSISDGLPKTMNSTARVCREDPVRKGMLYLGLDDGTFVSWDDGAHWTSLRLNLPATPVFGLVIQPHYSDLVLGTYGRGFWILDDISPLREWPEVQQSAFHLFKPRPVYRYRHVEVQVPADANSNVIGQNPPAGADLNFYLQAPAKDVTISITGPKGEAVRTLHVQGKAGINRVWWDLRYDKATPLELVTPPPGQPWVKPTNKPTAQWIRNPPVPTASGLPTRPYVSYGNFRGDALVTPGDYNVSIEADGKKLSAPITVMNDPHTQGSVQDIAQGTAFLLQVRSELTQMAEMVNNLELIRLRNHKVQDTLRNQNQDGLLKQAVSFDQDVVKVENNFVDMNLTGQSEDSFRNPMRLYGRLADLADQVNLSSWGGNGANLPPTDSVLAVHKVLQKQLAEFTQTYNQFVSKNVPAYDAKIKATGLFVSGSSTANGSR